MKSISRILITALLLLSFSANAQKGFYIGFSGNIASSLILNQNTYGIKWNIPGTRNFELAYDATLGYGGAFKLGYNFKEQLGFEWHAGYQALGMQYKDNDPNDITHTKSVSVDYITIAMAFRYTSIFKKNQYKQEQKVRLAIVVGPQFGILARGSLEYALEAEAISFTLSDEVLQYPNEFSLYNEAFYDSPVQDDKDLFNNIDAGILVQVGLDIYPKPWFYISPVLSTYLGITDMNAKAYRKHSGYGASRNAYIGLNLSMGFYINQ